MNKLKRTSSIQVEPSNRDSISTWLDVLTGMLVMPDTQRQQVRDELEDHLRSRVDDLLIIGESEPEAIRIAVAELGETAELAKLITHAHTKPNPRRTIMNTALVAVALAGMSFGGFTFINGTSAPSATPSNGGAVPVVVPEEVNKSDKQTHDFAIESGSALEILTEIAQAFDRELNLSPESSNPKMDSFLGRHKANIEGEFTFDQVVDQFKNRYIQGFFGYQLICDDQTIRLMTEDEYQRSIVVTRVYSYPKWLNTNDRIDYPHSLTKLIETKHDLRFASIQGVGDSIVVAAPPPIHKEIEAYQLQLESVLAEQRAIVDRRNSERDEARAMREEEAKQRRIQIQIDKEIARTQAVERIQIEFDRVRTQLIDSQSQISDLNARMMQLAGVFNSDNKVSSDEREQKMLQLQAMLTEMKLLNEEYQSRYNYLRDTLIESQYTELFKGLE